ncbi:hypothetical protein B0A67_10355 [Flavobacterium aquidurense]|uniref:hypothetical protein n=1 Tax=Flavobacterium aquidurense TaxID=362413 RepID=UPI000917C55A|nr:hypothetical protein [Flavobacterium aquidurense]OXA71747.1 hypothetical protein B0A67_10355 [Flavobacterium aquidurense]SHH21382.1 hypothetical protein SAMN05444481_11373 [Flavobacterium frigidimaris]
MKNIEIVAEIIADETKKLEKLVSEQSNLVKEFSICMEKALEMEIQPKTERLEEVIAHWNLLFTRQKNQIQELQNTQREENKKQRLGTYILLILTIILLISILLLLTFKRI